MSRTGRWPYILLVGFMMAGKTTVGRLLGERLAYGFLDLDEEIETLAGRSIPEIFRQGGESEFREIEARATAEADPPPGTVIATGGGWVMRASLRDRWPDGVAVWLRVSPKTVLSRMGEGSTARPMLDPSDPERTIRDLLAARESAYSRAQHVVDTNGRTPEEVVEDILERLAGG